MASGISLKTGHLPVGMWRVISSSAESGGPALPVSSATKSAVSSSAAPSAARAVVLAALLVLTVVSWFSLFDWLAEDTAAPHFWMQMRLLNGVGVAITAALIIAVFREGAEACRS